MEQVISHNVINNNTVLSTTYMECRALYLSRFNWIPCIANISNVEGDKAFVAFVEQHESLIESCYYYLVYEGKEGEVREWILALKNDCMLEFHLQYVLILYPAHLIEFVEELADLINQFKVKERRKSLEINLVVRESYGLALKPMEVKQSRLNLDLFYEDDFRETDALIRKRLNRKNDKGIVLLHGLPGTGKTTYLRYLIGKIKKRVLFLSSNLAGNMMDPEFIDLLINNPNSVVIVEDAEKIMMDRRNNGHSSVSTLLNITDGLLTDFLNIQLICTFNSTLSMVDPALMRKGRLIARYEFGKLSIAKAQRLSDHLGLDQLVTKPMTLAEIANPNDKEEVKVEVIGFKRQNEMMN